MSGVKVVPVEPTAEMVEAAQDAYMPFGDMDIALRMAVLAAPAGQNEAFEAIASQLLAKRAEILGRPLKWAEAIEITAIVTSMPDEEKQRLLDMDDAPAVQGEPVAWMYERGGKRTVMFHDPTETEEFHGLPKPTPLYTAPQPESQQPKCCTCRDGMDFTTINGVGIGVGEDITDGVYTLNVMAQGRTAR